MKYLRTLPSGSPLFIGCEIQQLFRNFSEPFHANPGSSLSTTTRMLYINFLKLSSRKHMLYLKQTILFSFTEMENPDNAKNNQWQKTITFGLNSEWPLAKKKVILIHHRSAPSRCWYSRLIYWPCQEGKLSQLWWKGRSHRLISWQSGESNSELHGWRQRPYQLSWQRCAGPKQAIQYL